MSNRKWGALLLAAALSLPGLAGASNRPDLPVEGGGGGGIVSGTINLQAVNGCYVVITGTVTTANVGGTVVAWVNVWDDGNFYEGFPIPVPGNGGTHPYIGVYHQQVPVLQGATGVGFYLEDGHGFDATDTYASDGNFNDHTHICTGPAPDISGYNAIAIPTLGVVGLVALVGILGLAAMLLLRRRSSQIPG